MKKLILTIFIFPLAFYLIAQNEGTIVHTIKGKVIDTTTNEAVSYTNIGLEDTFYGTASDEKGNFELKIPAALVTKNIYFSAVGFKNKAFPVQDLFDKEFNVIKLESQSYGIDDVEIATQSKVLLRILRMAAENIRMNYIGGPFNLLCNYSKEKVIDDSIKTQNARVVIFDENGYSQPSKSDAFKSIKYAVKKDEQDYRFSNGTINIDEMLELDWVRSASSVLNPNLLNSFQLKLLKEPTIDGKEFWVISFEQENPSLAGSGDYYATEFKGTITIGKADYEIKKTEGKILSLKNSKQGKSLAINPANTSYLKNVSSEFVVLYSNLKPEKIVLNKSFVENEKKISEKSVLEIYQVKTTQITKLESRDYFIGN